MIDEEEEEGNDDDDDDDVVVVVDNVVDNVVVGGIDSVGSGSAHPLGWLQWHGSEQFVKQL